MTRRWDLAEVTWGDAHGSDNGWVEPDELEHGPEAMITVGMIVTDDDEGITLCLSRHFDGTRVGGYIFIPRQNITSVKVLQTAYIET